MSNQTIFTGLFALSWLTLIFMKKADIKRFFPVALFATVTSAMILEIGISLGWWVYPVKFFPFQTIPYLYGPIPVATMWLFKFTYRRFWLYVAADAALNLFYTLIFENYFLESRGIIQFQQVSPMLDVLMTSILGIILYAYQIWQEGIFVFSEKESASTSFNLQPALKPLSGKEDNEGNDQS